MAHGHTTAHNGNTHSDQSIDDVGRECRSADFVRHSLKRNGSSPWSSVKTWCMFTCTLPCKYTIQWSALYEHYLWHRGKAFWGTVSVQWKRNYTCNASYHVQLKARRSNVPVNGAPFIAHGDTSQRSEWHGYENESWPKHVGSRFFTRTARKQSYTNKETIKQTCTHAHTHTLKS